MSDTIFTDDFLEVKNNEELEIIKKRYHKYDPYYVASGCIKKQHDYFNKLWRTYKPLADKNFLLEIKNHFHKRIWEMYLGTILIQNNFNVSSHDKGPDFILNEYKDEEIFIEAVACEKGDTIDAVPDMVMGKVINLPENEMLIRLVNSLDFKYKKYKDFIEKENKPYIIGICREELEHIDGQIPLILKCLFGIGNQHFEDIDGKLVYGGWTKRCFIEKKNKSKVPMTFFENKEYNGVSAVIYSEVVGLNYPSEIGSDCIIIHNPNALRPINLNVFSFLKQYQASYNKNELHIKEVK